MPRRHLSVQRAPLPAKLWPKGHTAGRPSISLHRAWSVGHRRGENWQSSCGAVPWPAAHLGRCSCLRLPDLNAHQVSGHDFHLGRHHSRPRPHHDLPRDAHVLPLAHLQPLPRRTQSPPPRQVQRSATTSVRGQSGSQPQANPQRTIREENGEDRWMDIARCSSSTAQACCCGRRDGTFGSGDAADASSASVQDLMRRTNDFESN